MECDVCERKVMVQPVTIQVTVRGEPEFSSVLAAELCPSCQASVRATVLGAVNEARRHQKAG